MVLEWPDISRCSRCSIRLCILLLGFLEGTEVGLNITGQNSQMKLEVSGCPWVCLGEF